MDRAGREIKTEIQALERRGALHDPASSKADLDTATIGHLLAEAISLTDEQVARAWERETAEATAASDVAREEVERVLASVARSADAGLPPGSTDVEAEGSS
jgi:hypothetical protein